jgi:lysophospholipase L1-like esterase
MDSLREPFRLSRRRGRGIVPPRRSRRFRVFVAVSIVAAAALVPAYTATAEVTSGDKDGDGVAQAADRCPGERGPANNGGCPANTYVALGDSFPTGIGTGTPGEGLGSSDPGDVPCGRTTDGYPLLLQKDRKYGQFLFKPCSGAKVGNFAETQLREGTTMPSQLSWLRKSPADVKLVTVQVGGNDFGYVDVLMRCIVGFGLLPCGDSVKQAANAQLQTVSGGLVTLFRTIRTTVPNARVVIVGYPRLFPETPPDTCNVGYVFSLSRADAQALNQGVDLLNTTIQRAVTAAAAKTGQRIDYLDSNRVFAKHELCNTVGGTVALYGVKLSGLSLNGVKMDGSFHPNHLGQTLYASAIKALLTRR